MKHIGLIDADLLWSNTRHPNLALMKLSAFHKDSGDEVALLSHCTHLNQFDKVYVASVFDYTPVPAGLFGQSNVMLGGTGFFQGKAANLPYEVEHHMPDYSLYAEYIVQEVARGIRPIHFRDYEDYSIGFATRGCFRKCSFCVNRKYDAAFRHAPVREFFDASRKHIYLWDDNIFACPDWCDVFDELEETGRRFQFRQGLDIRLLNEEKAETLSKAKYIGDYIFAFDFLADRDVVERNLKVWWKHSQGTTKLYVLCGYESQDIEDIISVLERIRILMSYRCVPYIMRYSGWESSPLRGIYVELARWCNQPNFFKKKSFREFCEANGAQSASMRSLSEFETKYPGLSKAYFDRKFETEPVRF